MKTSRQVERLSRIIFLLFVKIALQLVMIPKCIASFSTYFMTDLGPDSFDLPAPMWYISPFQEAWILENVVKFHFHFKRFPFDFYNPIGYLIAFILEYIFLGYEYFVIACTLAVGIGESWFIISATKEIQRNLRSINKKIQTNKIPSTKLMSMFSKFIDIHGNVKQLSIIYKYYEKKAK